MSASVLGHYLNGLKVGSTTSWCRVASRTAHSVFQLCVSHNTASLASPSYIRRQRPSDDVVLFPCLE